LEVTLLLLNILFVFVTYLFTFSVCSYKLMWRRVQIVRMNSTTSVAWHN